MCVRLIGLVNISECALRQILELLVVLVVVRGNGGLISFLRLAVTPELWWFFLTNMIVFD